MQLITRLIIAFAFICAIAAFVGPAVDAADSADGHSQQSAPTTATNGMPTNNVGMPFVSASVFFKGKKSVSVAELREHAIEELRKKSYKIDATYRCGINIAVDDNESACVVLFTKAFGQPAYEVVFDWEGKVRVARKFIAREGAVQRPEDLIKRSKE